MKLLNAIIYGFGKFYQKSISFQDGIHVIHGPNEAGKSTLHTFLGCMLFGLERGRGRAAKGDLYSRCLPWDHDATYGGSLTFESDDHSYRIERNFRSDRRSCLLSGPGMMPVACNDSDLTERYYEGLTESLYYNTISVRSLGCAPDASLAQELSRQLADFHQTGSDTIDYSAAASWLRAERKRQEAQLDPDLEKQILLKKQSLDQLELRLQNTTFQERKAALEQEMDECLERLAELRPDNGQASETTSDTKHFQQRGTSHFLSWVLLLTLAVIAGVLWSNGQQIGGAVTGIATLVFLLFTILRGRPKNYENCDEDMDIDESDEDSHDTLISADSRTGRLRLHLRSLQKQYESICRQEWDHDRLLEQAHALEEELEQLTALAAEEENIRLEIQAIALAASTLQRLAGQMQDSVGPQLSDSMSRILEGLTGGAYTEVFVDGQLNVSVRHTGVSAAFSRTVPLESLSRGTIEQIYLAMRLAVIDLLFPQGGMPLLLDDCFLAYDDDRLTQTLLWLAENYSGQVFIFTCQKREAALLRKEQIPFTDLSL